MYKEEQLVRVAKRENNKKRNYLVVNQLQGKHIPVKPGEAFSMFKALADTCKDAYKNEKLLIVGFAETATAIGAAVAVELGTTYIQTTREVVENVEYLFFSEEHSHATEQKLVKNDIDVIFGTIDRILFVEDEVTTGKTIRNIINILEKQYDKKIKFSVASLLNGMNEEALQTYQDREILLHYLVKTNHDVYEKQAEAYKGDGIYIPCKAEKTQEIEEITADGWMNTRRLTDTVQYTQAVEQLWNQVKNHIGMDCLQRVLVVGTEEFMYPALYVAKKIEECGLEVYCHSTTRSPIAVSSEESYPLHTRYELRSLYDSNRTTFLYDIGEYDQVIIITDAHKNEEQGLNSLVNALAVKNNKISLFRWK